jgi:hypothetical protein
MSVALWTSLLPRRLDLVLPRRDHETGGEALDVPLEGAREGLVEVAQVE